MKLLFLAIDIVICLTMIISGALNMRSNNAICLIQIATAVLALYYALDVVRSLISVNVLEIPHED